jgi:MoaE-MoaD fusion protein
VLFFGLAHDAPGFEQAETEVAEGESLGTLWNRYKEQFPRLAELAESVLVAVNETAADLSTPLKDGDEVAILPPVSGGAAGNVYRLIKEAIPTQELCVELSAPGDGAVVVFEGIVRNYSGGRRTLFLEYEAYESMALRAMEAIGEEAKKKFAIDRVGMIHRTGHIEIGEVSVAVVVTAPHRAAAFEACRYAIDQLKLRVPIWKKEHFEDGSMWAAGEAEKALIAQAQQV